MPGIIHKALAKDPEAQLRERDDRGLRSYLDGRPGTGVPGRSISHGASRSVGATRSPRPCSHSFALSAAQPRSLLFAGPRAKPNEPIRTDFLISLFRVCPARTAARSSRPTGPIGAPSASTRISPRNRCRRARFDDDRHGVFDDGPCAEPLLQRAAKVLRQRQAATTTISRTRGYALHGCATTSTAGAMRCVCNARSRCCMAIRLRRNHRYSGAHVQAHQDSLSPTRPSMNMKARYPRSSAPAAQRRPACQWTMRISCATVVMSQARAPISRRRSRSTRGSSG